MDNLNSILEQRLKASTTSEKYKVITTKDLLNKFTDAGYEIRSSSVAKTYKPERQGYQRHLVRLQHPELAFKKVNDSRPEIVVTNSYDGSSSLTLTLGIYRLVCANGMVVGHSFKQHKIRHVGDALDLALTAASEITLELEKLETMIGSWSHRVLTSTELEVLYLRVWDQFKPYKDATLVSKLSDAFEARRDADAPNDLWTVFNRIQETIMRGGIQYELPDTFNGRRTNRLRAVKAIKRNLDVNQRLFDLTEKFYSEVA